VTMSLLAIDVGNTRLKWACYEGRGLCSHANLLTADAITASTLSLEWQALQPTSAIVSNVAGAEIATSIKQVLARKNIDPLFIASASSQCGVTNSYEQPQQLGTDRWAALIGAHRAEPNRCAKVVVMAGTALTVDALSADGKFLGGIIVPGLGVMRQALHLRTAQLPPPLPTEMGQFEMFPTNTLNAIASGAIDACVGAISRMLVRLSEIDNNAATPIVIASGGALALLAPHAPFPLTIHENLVLEGLLHIALESHSN
jgi:type III pantothenate kinase